MGRGVDHSLGSVYFGCAGSLGSKHYTCHDWWLNCYFQRGRDWQLPFSFEYFASACQYPIKVQSSYLCLMNNLGSCLLLCIWNLLNHLRFRIQSRRWVSQPSKSVWTRQFDKWISAEFWILAQSKPGWAASIVWYVHDESKINFTKLTSLPRIFVTPI